MRDASCLSVRTQLPSGACPASMRWACLTGSGLQRPPIVPLQRTRYPPTDHISRTPSIPFNTLVRPNARAASLFAALGEHTISPRRQRTCRRELIPPPTRPPSTSYVPKSSPSTPPCARTRARRRLLPLSASTPFRRADKEHVAVHSFLHRPARRPHPSNPLHRPQHPCAPERARGVIVRHSGRARHFAALTENLSPRTQFTADPPADHILRTKPIAFNIPMCQNVRAASLLAALGEHTILAPQSRTCCRARNSPPMRVPSTSYVPPTPPSTPACAGTRARRRCSTLSASTPTTNLSPHAHFVANTPAKHILRTNGIAFNTPMCKNARAASLFAALGEYTISPRRQRTCHYALNSSPARASTTSPVPPTSPSTPSWCGTRPGVVVRGSRRARHFAALTKTLSPRAQFAADPPAEHILRTKLIAVNTSMCQNARPASPFTAVGEHTISARRRRTCRRALISPPTRPPTTSLEPPTPPSTPLCTRTRARRHRPPLWARTPFRRADRELVAASSFRRRPARRAHPTYQTYRLQHPHLPERPRGVAVCCSRRAHHFGAPIKNMLPRAQFTADARTEHILRTPYAALNTRMCRNARPASPFAALGEHADNELIAARSFHRRHAHRPHPTYLPHCLQNPRAPEHPPDVVVFRSPQARHFAAQTKNMLPPAHFAAVPPLKHIPATLCIPCNTGMPYFV
ncbi:hypothetical protein BD626DRAFT_579503 [Schizophyllum amplum]|uniref:Uncharacterized protein n=1 Tax=Schizophyllum amplum TaxID=97359 RepID=A0A550BRI6_9AGAR|nr:hypothetical protein BD626DRAFT_579503 [Auriculariopsis ampla]